MTTMKKDKNKNNPKSWPKQIWVHGGPFHGDDAMAVTMLRKLNPDAKINRVTQLPKDMSDEDIAVDIGHGAYDHHQPGGNGHRSNGVPYASAGLVFRDFGLLICKDTCDPEYVAATVDRELIQGIDAVDCGAMPKLDYPAQKYGVSQVLGAFNPVWNGEQDFDAAFMRAVDLAEVLLDNCIANANAKAAAKPGLQAALDELDKNDPVLVLDRYIPWQEYLFRSEQDKRVLFVVYPSDRQGYAVVCVPAFLGGTSPKKPFPEQWRGLSGSELQQACGVKTAIFCHPNGFIAGAETLVDALRMTKF